MYGVITGDIVGFTKLTVKDRNHLLDILQRIIAKVNESGYKKIEFQMYRGDAFQLIIPQAVYSLRIALLIRLGLIASRITFNYPSERKNSVWDARLSIGIGEIDYIKENLSLSDGEAFHYSGRMFDMLKKSDRLAVRTPWQETNAELEVECFMADTIIRRLSGKQASITYQYMLENITQKNLAEDMGISPQAINKSLQQGGNALQEFIKRFETLMEKHNQ